MQPSVKNRDLRSFEIRFEFESAVRFHSIRKGLADSIFESNRLCVPLTRLKLSQTTQTINAIAL